MLRISHLALNKVQVWGILGSEGKEFACNEGNPG